MRSLLAVALLTTVSVAWARHPVTEKNARPLVKARGSVYNLKNPTRAVKPAAAKQGKGSLDAKIEEQYKLSWDFLFQNLTEPGVAMGAVIASPSRDNPNYFFHWVRDAGLVMDTLSRRYATADDLKIKIDTYTQLMKWVKFEGHLQRTGNYSGGQGEPKFNVDGTAFNGPWGRPQNDGPALRAIAMIRFAEALLKEGKKEVVEKHLYCSPLPAQCPIKLDLEFVSHHWSEPSFDVWEEVKGQHFFTLIFQRKALMMGATLAEKFNDGAAADFYKYQALQISSIMEKHLNKQKGLIVPTLNRVDGWDHKKSGQDIAVLIGIIHGYMDDEFFSPDNEWVMKTAAKLEATFASMYAINQNKAVAPAIGRYPEDIFDGNGFGGGNPWFIATNAMAELYCRAAVLDTKNSNTYFARGTRFLERALQHVHKDGRMNEQINKDTGILQGARDLTWSYASFITAADACRNKATFKKTVPLKR